MIRTSIPCGEVARTRFAATGPLAWLAPDSEENARRRPHPLFGPDDVTYCFNSHGYRGPELAHRGELTLLCLGCSWTFGTGLPFELTYPEVLRCLLEHRLGCSVGCWNLAMPAGSNDFISRTALSALPVLAPDLVLVMFTTAPRREFFAADGQVFHIIPNLLGRPPSGLAKKILRYHRELASGPQDEIVFFKNYKLIELLVAQHGVPWLYTALDRRDLEPCAPLLDAQSDLGFGIEKLDAARDYMHPGPESCRHFAERVAPRAAELLAARRLQPRKDSKTATSRPSSS